MNAQRRPVSLPLVVVIFSVLILVTVAVALGLGASSVSFGRIIPTLLGHGTSKEHFVLFELRLPRIAITLLAGMALALSGSILQGVTRNDLADPGLIGINAGAGVGVAAFFLFASIEPGSFVYLIPLCAFVGAVATACLIYLFAYSRSEGLQPIRLVLVGVGFSLALSGIMVILTSSADRRKVDFIAKWLAGNIWGNDMSFVWALLPWILLLLPIVLYYSRTLNMLSMDESIAIGSGVAVTKARGAMLLVAVALAAAAVSVTGGISFVGLMAPHIAKALVGPRFQRFVPVATLLGGFLLLLADTIGRNVAQPNGLAAGLVIALIGAPYFIYLLLRRV